MLKIDKNFNFSEYFFFSNKYSPKSFQKLLQLNVDENNVLCWKCLNMIQILYQKEKRNT